MLTLSPPQKALLDLAIPQLFMLGYPTYSYHNNPHLGSLIAFDSPPNSNIKSPLHIQAINAQIAQRYPDVFRAIDCEGGINWTKDHNDQAIRHGVNRLNPSNGFPATLCAAQISDLVSKGQLVEAEQACNEIAQLIHANGFNLTCAPVVDLNLNSESSIIAQQGRSFGSTAHHVIQCAELFINACSQLSIQTVLKHYPGHGSVQGDSHRALTDITTQFSAQELLPYASLVNLSGMVMSAHLIHRDVDHCPASISKIWLDKLRTEYNFNGVIIADDLQMDGIHAYIKEQHTETLAAIPTIDQPSYILERTIIAALNAGNDMLIIGNQLKPHPNLLEFCIACVHRAVIMEEISLERIISAYQHIRSIKPQLTPYHTISSLAAHPEE